MAGKRSSGVFVSWPKPDFTKTVLTNKHFKTNFHAAMLYAHYELSPADLVKEINKYLRTLDPKHPLLERVRAVDENRIASYGKYLYVLNHGGDIPTDIKAVILERLEKTLIEEEAKILEAAKNSQRVETEKSTPAVVNKPAVYVPTIQDRIRDRAREVAGEVEGWLDDWIMDKKTPIKTVEDFVALFKGSELKAVHIVHIRSAFHKRAKEFEEVIKGEDKQLVEGYSNFTKTEMKKMVVMMRNLFLACDMMQEVAKVVRAPRKKKPVSLDKVVAKLKYKKEDPQLGIVSMNPIHIVGSKEVWVYNTKTRKLGVYKAVDADGLTVKGTGILNYSPDSVEKTLRKPADTLAEFKKASKVKLRTFLKELSTVDVPCQGKLNEHHVILRIDK